MPEAFEDTVAACWAAAKAASYELTCAVEGSLPHVRATADKMRQNSVATDAMSMTVLKSKN